MTTHTLKTLRELAQSGKDRVTDMSFSRCENRCAMRLASSETPEISDGVLEETLTIKFLSFDHKNNPLYQLARKCEPIAFESPMGLEYETLVSTSCEISIGCYHPSVSHVTIVLAGAMV